MEAVLTLVPQSVLVLIVILMLERLLPLRPHYSPIYFFKALTLGISAKVHSTKRPAAISQQKIAGALAIPTLVLPFLFVFYMMIAVVEFPIVFDGILLWLCLSWSPLRKDAASVAKALDKGNKSLAKARLSPLVARSTAQLSPMGMAKTSVEMLLLRASKEYFAVIFYFLCFGSLPMLVYRLMMMLNHSWNPKFVRYKYFGGIAHSLGYLLEWLPSRLCTLTIMLLGHFRLSFDLIAQARRWGNDNSLYLLAAAAASLKVSLGGPVFYNASKIRRPVIGNKHTGDPNSNSIHHAIALVEKMLIVWLLIILLVSLMYYALAQ